MSGTRCLLSKGWRPMPSAVAIGAIVLWLKWIAIVPSSERDVYSAVNLRRFPDVCRLQSIFDPVSGEIDADLAVVDVGMLCAAFFGREDLDCLVFRTDRIKELLGIFDRHDPVVRAVGDEERACDVLRHVIQSEFFCDGASVFRRFRP